MPDTKRREDLAEEAVRLGAILREAGALALKTFRMPIKSWTKERNSPVSEADLAVDALLRARLMRPDLGWLSEESADDHSRLARPALYIADPIDGTRAYLAGLPDWSICAALVEHGRPVVAGLYAPVADSLYLATSGGGATCNGARLTVSAGSALAGARVAGPAGPLKRLEDHVDILKMPKIHSLALRLSLVAQGGVKDGVKEGANRPGGAALEAEIAPDGLDVALASVNAHDWDLAAADLLVHEAGGLMTDLAGEKLSYNRPRPVHGAVVAAGPARHAEVLALTRRHHDIFC